MLCRIAELPEIGVGELGQEFPLSKSTLSYHVRLLREARLVTVRKAGRHRYVRLRVQGLVAMVDAVQEQLLFADRPRLGLSA